MYKESDKNLINKEPFILVPNRSKVKPFLKWAGGKTQLLDELNKYIPLNYNKYIEPFIGGGALFFSLNSKESVISDSNRELIITYKQVRDNVESVISILKTFEHTETFYYEIRNLIPDDLEKDFRAARLIYLNKTCFNGLYRVNKKGLFNVPYGKGKGEFLQENVLREASRFLQSTQIICADYLEVLGEFAKPNDFIFLDPPYYPVGKYSDFERYTKEFLSKN